MNYYKKAVKPHHKYNEYDHDDAVHVSDEIINTVNNISRDNGTNLEQFRRLSSLLKKDLVLTESIFADEFMYVLKSNMFNSDDIVYLFVGSYILKFLDEKTLNDMYGVLPDLIQLLREKFDQNVFQIVDNIYRYYVNACYNKVTDTYITVNDISWFSNYTVDYHAKLNVLALGYFIYDECESPEFKDKFPLCVLEEVLKNGTMLPNEESYKVVLTLMLRDFSKSSDAFSIYLMRPEVQEKICIFLKSCGGSGLAYHLRCLNFINRHNNVDLMEGIKFLKDNIFSSDEETDHTRKLDCFYILENIFNTYQNDEMFLKLQPEVVIDYLILTCKYLSENQTTDYAILLVYYICFSISLSTKLFIEKSGDLLYTYTQHLIDVIEFQSDYQQAVFLAVGGIGNLICYEKSANFCNVTSYLLNNNIISVLNQYMESGTIHGVEVVQSIINSLVQ